MQREEKQNPVFSLQAIQFSSLTPESVEITVMGLARQSVYVAGFQPNVEKILLEILNELKAQSAEKSDLWAASDIARYMRLSTSSIQSRVICRKDFPRAVRIPTDNGMGGRRWYAKEVKDWVARNREPIR